MTKDSIFDGFDDFLKRSEKEKQLAKIWEHIGALHDLLTPYFDEKYRKDNEKSYTELIKSQFRALIELCERIGIKLDEVKK